uniref:Pre-mRNA-splicing factor 38 n=1 Tax=Acrobeloides nanus TaxID=290746 RepID=A0A914E0I1_9BILA
MANDPPDMSVFREMMGFSNPSEVMYEDDAADSSIPDIQKITKKNNILPTWGNKVTMNLNTLILENILQSTYFKNFLNEITTFDQLKDEIYYNVVHLEPWERGTRKTQGMTGMCGGVRGVGAGGVISTAFCLLYKMFALKITRKQLVSLINNTQSAYLRGMGFLYIRFTQPPQDLWPWFEAYLDDEEEIDPRSGGGDKMTVAQMVKMMLNKLDWYGTLFPRIPVPVQKVIENHFRELSKHESRDRQSQEKSIKKEWESTERTRSRERDVRRRSRSRSKNRRRSRSRSPRDRDRRRDRSRDRRSRDRELNKNSKDDRKKPIGVNRFRCSHHLRHHHCRKHRTRCPTKAKKARELKDQSEKQQQEKEIASASTSS